MGKQKGDGPRPKARPSSSSLAASLLPTGATTVGFGGYVGSSRLGPSTSSDDSVPFADVDGEMAQHLKRLGRKDHPTTKLKALTSLREIFKEKPGELVQILPQWAFEYKRLLLDYNRDVRRATHDAMFNLASTIGRGLAPHLKSLMGPWWFSQFDPISEVSNAARRSLQAAFPAQEKRLDALILCASEIFLYLDENLKLTPQALSDKAAPLDELEDMHQRVISSSLLALAALVDILLGMQLQRNDFESVTMESKHASKARATAISSAEKMFSSHKYFLEFLKFQSPGIRSATYSVLSCFIKHIPNVFNEGNMKVLSAAILGAFQEKDPTCHSSMWDAILLFSKRFPDSWYLNNAQKNALTRFWNFLRKGCHGSLQVSYPVLVLFLDSIPPKAINGEHFFLSFFQNLWAGRNPLCSSADRLAFLKAFKECFLWGIYNASRYCEGVDTIDHLRVSLIDNVLVMLVWHDYLLLVNPKYQAEHLSQESSETEGDIKPSFERLTKSLNIKYPEGYMQDLGKWIVEILSDIAVKECSLLDSFCASFQKDCLSIFQEAETSQKPSTCAEQIVNFLFLVEQHVVRKGETWPLVYLVRPMVATSFPLIKSLNSSDGVRIFSVVAEIFGPQTVLSEFLVNNKVQPDGDSTFEGANELKLKLLLQVFNDDFVPWCLDGNHLSSSGRMDLLLGLLDDELFSEQWHSIISYVLQAEYDYGTESGYSDMDRIEMLAILMEKVRIKIGSRKLRNDSSHPWGSLPEHWHHDLLNSAAVSISCRSPPFGAHHSRFLCAVLAGSKEDEQTSFLSRVTMIHIFEGILRKLVSFLMDSSFSWAKHAGSLVQSMGSMDLQNTSESSSKMVLLEAQFALEVLDGSFYCLKLLDDDCSLIPCILGAILFIEWECYMEKLKNPGYRTSVGSSGSVSEDVSDDSSPSHLNAKLALGEAFHAFCSKITTYFWKGLSFSIRQKLGDMLVQVIRFTLFETDVLCMDRASALCCKWVLNVLELICLGHDEEQCFLDQLLAENKYWPLWVAPYFNSGRSAKLKSETSWADNHAFQQHHQFVAFVEKLISSLGASRVIAGSVSSSVEEVWDSLDLSHNYSRVWLAAEMMCSWKWHGGSALGSLLPFLCEYAKTRYSTGKSLAYSTASILLDGALVHGATGNMNFLNVWTLSDDEIEDIQDPFLRALLSFLLCLFVKDNIWGKDEAATLFRLVSSKLFIDTTMNKSCLRILPCLMNILIQSLRNDSTRVDSANEGIPHDSLEEPFYDVVAGWLQTAISFPPLTTWQTGQHDFEEWIHVALSCYPLSTGGGMETLKMALSSNIGQSEKTVLLELFRKHRCDFDALTITLSLSVQITLAKLMAVAVGYCWQEFDESDWEFVLSQLYRWIESAVLLMEEMAEDVDDAVIHASSSDGSEVIKKLENAVKVLDPSIMNTAKTALFIFSLFSGLTERQKSEDAETSHCLRIERWAHNKERILESVLRLFFATGVTEAIASTSSEEASSIVSSARLSHSHFWQLVAFSVINSSHDVRKNAVHSIELWGLSIGPISSLYAVLFSSKPIPSLQVAAYMILSAEPICHVAITKDSISCCSDGGIGNQETGPTHDIKSSLEEPVNLRDEIACLIERSTPEVLEMDSVSQQRVHTFIAWALVLTHIQSLPSSSPARERLIQHIQDYASTTILDCIFQHIPLKLGLAHHTKKKDIELPTEVSKAAAAAKRAITTCSVLFALESLWPIGAEQMASLTGAIYGLMLCLLPAYVRNWFTGLRDRSRSSAIESFTKTWCSPPLLSDELSQIKATVVVDENFSVSVNKSAYEVIATYQKEETGMDLVICLPSCYPLRPVDVNCTRSLGISEVKQRKWLLSLAAFVRNQNGALAEAIRIWKSNFDKEFQGVEECPICYSIIHTTNHSLPRLACKTCKHKFHAACLYKWFSTSHKSTCPLCQTPF